VLYIAQNNYHLITYIVGQFVNSIHSQSYKVPKH